MTRVLAGHGPAMERLGRFVAAPLIALRVPPNLLTVLGALLVGVPAYFAWQGDYVLAGFWFGLVSILDMLDGVVARATGTATRFGGYLDSVLDRVSDAVILIGIGAGLTGAGWWPLVGAGLIGQYATSYTRARVYQDARPGPEVWRQFFERPERVLFLTALLLTQGFLNRAGPTPVPAPEWVAAEAAVLFWGLVLYAAATLATAAARVWKARLWLRDDSEERKK